jgi:DNA-binding SARP family transcriptional activator/Tfp pilus assembly protein PilF
MMEFGLLGPLVVRSGERVLAVPQGHQRTLLAMLLLDANKVVPAGEIAETLWGAAAPPSAAVSVRNYVRRLRQTLGEAGQDRISFRQHGYVIGVAEDELDVSRFENLLASALAAARTGSWDQAAATAGQALVLWRGEPLADIESDALALRERPRLGELRLQAAEICAEAGLRLGRHAEVLPGVQRLAAEHPLREHVHALLMLALYRCGRQAEALIAYQQARTVLVGELGIEPGAELRDLHQQILAADPALELCGDATMPGSAAASGGVRDARTADGRGTGAASLGSRPAAEVPRQLPAVVAEFTGRAAELAALTEILDQASASAPGTVVISAIGGTAGVGKTALALHWAHQVAARFPDGQLYVNLRGFDPVGLPAAPGEAIRGFLDALGVPPERLPPSPESQAALYRSLVAGRQMLIVADNARDEQQVRPLLPASPGCLVLITSRSQLTGLAAADGARLLTVDVLPEAEARQFLSARIGHTRAAAEPEAVAEIARLCARLPLALAVAAARAAARPGLPLAALAAQLSDVPGRLDALETGDPAASVRAIFSWSYDHLDAESARAFRLAGLHPSADFEAYGVAALTGSTPEQAHRVLDTLARAHLIQPTASGRYGMHDLLRAYALDRTSATDSEDEQHAALSSLLDHYLYSNAIALMALGNPDGEGRRLDPPSPPADAPAQPLDNPEAAMEWVEAERSTLNALAALAIHAVLHGWAGKTAPLAAFLVRDLEVSGYAPDISVIGGDEREAARQAGSRSAEPTALNYLAGMDWRLGRFGQASSRLHEALALYRESGDQESVARVLGSLGKLELERGSCDEAESLLQQAVAMHRANGVRASEAVALSNLGNVHERQGRYQQAKAHHDRALVLFREMENARGEAMALDNLGVLEQRYGRLGRAADFHQRAMLLFRQNHDPIKEAEAVAHLGNVELRQGSFEQAIAHLRWAAEMRFLMGLRPAETEARNNLGRALLAHGQPGPGQAEHSTALRLASQIGHKHEQARAHHGLADCYQASGETVLARDHRQQALALYAELGLAEADGTHAKAVNSATVP